MSVLRLANAFFCKRSTYLSGNCVAMGPPKDGLPRWNLLSMTLSFPAGSVQRRLHPAVENARGIDAGGFAKNGRQLFDSEGSAVALAPIHLVGEGVAQVFLPGGLRGNALLGLGGHQGPARKKV